VAEGSKPGVVDRQNAIADQLASLSRPNPVRRLRNQSFENGNTNRQETKKSPGQVVLSMLGCCDLLGILSTLSVTRLGLPTPTIIPKDGHRTPMFSPLTNFRFFCFPQVAERTKKSPGQVVLRWGVQRGTSVLPKSTNPDRVKQNLDVLDWELSEEDMKTLGSIEPKVGFCFYLPLTT
jgi:hypothetical protein